MMMMMMRRGEEEVKDKDTDKDQDEDAAEPAGGGGGGGDTYKHPSSYAIGLVGQNTSMVLVDGKPHWDGHWWDLIGFVHVVF